MGYKEVEKWALRDLKRVEKRGAPPWLLNYMRSIICKAQSLYLQSKDQDQGRDERRFDLDRAKIEVQRVSAIATAFMYPEMYERFAERGTE